MFGVHDRREEALQARHPDVRDRRPAEGERSLASGLLPGAPVERQQERCEVGRHDVGEALSERLLVGERAALHDRLLGERDVAAVAPGERPDRRRGVLLDLLAHDAFDRLALTAHRMRCPGVRPRRHGGKIGGHQEEEPRRGGLRPGGCDIDDHRCRGPEHRGRDLTGRREQSARGVELHHQQGSAGAVGILQGFDEVLLRHRMQNRPQAQVHDFARRACRARSARSCRRRDRRGGRRRVGRSGRTRRGSVLGERQAGSREQGQTEKGDRGVPERAEGAKLTSEIAHRTPRA